MDVSEIISTLGGPTEIGRKFGISPGAVCNWKLRGGIPRSRQLQVMIELDRVGIKMDAEQFMRMVGK